MNRKRINVSSPFSATCQVSVDIQIQGHKWIMHEHDADINDPSCPHLHAKDINWKLDIYTGYMYSYPEKKYVGKASKKEMKNLWKQKDFVELVLRERLWYEKEYHSKNPQRYPILPSVSVSCKHKKLYVRVSKKWIRKQVPYYAKW